MDGIILERFRKATDRLYGTFDTFKAVTYGKADQNERAGKKKRK